MLICAGLGCGPVATGDDADASGGGASGGSATPTSGEGSTGATVTTSTSSTSEAQTGDDAPQPKFDVPPQEPEPDPCASTEELEPDECYALGVAYPTSSPSWPLQDNAGGCALVCIGYRCFADVCVDFVEEIRVVHEGPRVSVAAPNTDLFETADSMGVEIVQAEGWSEQTRYHVSHPVDDDSVYAVWATDEVTQQVLWGPIEMSRYMP